MKIGVVGDIHWSKYSSILRLRGEKYSYRLENCIKSIRWAESITKNCDLVVYLGDFFDSSELNSEEITALSELSDENNPAWNSVEHIFLVGNHEMGTNDLSYSSSHIFNYLKFNSSNTKSTVVSEPVSVEKDNCNLCFLPYILEENRDALPEYLELFNSNKTVIFSHNDIAGMQMGKFKSVNGFSIEEIHDSCDLFLNGHLHNGAKVTDKIINVGNLTGQNFSEDAFSYDHSVIILDTNDLKCAVYENPFALNFYKIDTTTADFDINTIKNNAIITLKTTLSNQAKYKELLDNSEKVLVSRIIIAPEEGMSTNDSTENKEFFAVNHLTKFSEYVLNNIGNSDIIKSELSEVLS